MLQPSDISSRSVDNYACQRDGIPRIAHFIWLGTGFHWVHALALRSAALRGGFERVILHHGDVLSSSPGWALVSQTPGISCRRLVAEEILGRVPDLASELGTLYRCLTKAEARSNLLRVALLYDVGGVYLDTDTVTIGSFGPLFAESAFCGLERIALPADMTHARRPGRWLQAAARLTARDICRRVPNGWRAFRYLAPLYALEANNAVLGARPGHPFFRQWLETMVQLPRRAQQRRFALGPHMLQRLVRDNANAPHLCAPERFYPLPPEVSQHWFRTCRRPQLSQVISPDTISVHWYASVRTRDLVPRIDEQYVRVHAPKQLFSALAKPLLDDAPVPSRACATLSSDGCKAQQADVYASS